MFPSIHLLFTSDSLLAPSRFQQLTPRDAHVYLPCLSPSAAVVTLSASLSSHPQSPTPVQGATVSPPPVIDQSLIPAHVPTASSTEGSKEPELDILTQVPTASPVKEIEKPKLDAFIRYELRALLALWQSPNVRFPDNFTEIATEIQ